MWDLVLVLCDGEESSLPASYSKGIIHSKHLIKYKAVSMLLLLVQAQVFHHELAISRLFVNITGDTDHSSGRFLCLINSKEGNKLVHAIDIPRQNRADREKLSVTDSIVFLSPKHRN